MDGESLTKLELNKILAACAEYATLGKTKAQICGLQPSSDVKEVTKRLTLTGESEALLFNLGIGKVEYFPDVDELIVRASKGAALSCRELLNVNCLLRSARSAYQGITCAEGAEGMKELASRLYFDEKLEEDIASKILSDELISDYASDALFTIRSKIKSLNEKIRSTLSEYTSGKDREYLQDSVVTIRGDRYVIPVKAEHKSKVKGFVHDRSQTGATFFIEPEYILNLNNELIALTIDEKQEIERILKALSSRVGAMREKLEGDIEALAEIDGYFCRAEYAYSIKAICPQINKRGYINIIKGRHPLIDAKKVVPVSIELGGKFSYLLLSGANTGGKTVTLKMVGLFCLMAECGLFIPAAAGSEVCAFEKIFCDVGDSQSIEESLSTFSSHVTNVIKICECADKDSLVLIDELGGGTNPDEGQALAKAVCDRLLSVKSKGIITTHFTHLKEYAYAKEGVENAAMQFDGVTLKPLYSIKIGLAGASNALAICRRLGMPAEILEGAEGYLSDEGRTYDNILRRAEESRIEAEEAKARAKRLEDEWAQKNQEVERALTRLEKEKRNLTAGARAETRRIINERTARAEQLLSEIEELFSKEEIAQTDLIKARTLKNKIKDEAYGEEEEYARPAYAPLSPQDIKAGMQVFVQSLQSKGEVLSFNAAKNEAEVLCGNMRLHVGISKLTAICPPPSKGGANGGRQNKDKERKVTVNRKFSQTTPVLEINVLGMTVEEALCEVENFIDRAITDNLEQVKIIHGMGTGKLRSAISQRLKSHRGVKEFRLGVYGEGESGVTIVTLK